MYSFFRPCKKIVLSVGNFNIFLLKFKKFPSKSNKSTQELCRYNMYFWSSVVFMFNLKLTLRRAYMKTICGGLFSYCDYCIVIYRVCYELCNCVLKYDEILCFFFNLSNPNWIKFLFKKSLLILTTHTYTSRERVYFLSKSLHS